MQAEQLPATVVNFINELKTNHEQQIQEIKSHYEQQLGIMQTSIREYQNNYLQIKERYDLLVFKRFARSAEQLPADANQPLLFAEEAAQRATDEPTPSEDTVDVPSGELTAVASYQRKKAGRQALDPAIPREERIVDLPESEKTCACGAALSKIGEESNEKLHIVPPRMYVEKTIRPKYACRKCEGAEDEGKPAVRLMPVEPAIIPRSIASPSLLSYIIVHKYEDHLPYYRQEKQFERIGVTISRQDMANWQQHVYAKLKPLFALLQATLKSGPVLQMDETTVQVMGEEGREDTQKSYMWLARGGPPRQTVVLYNYRPTRAAYHAKDLLAGYSGYLQTDGYEAYDKAVRDLPGIVHVGCFAHARRYFFEASKASKKPQSAEEGVKYIRKLYVIENEMRAQYKDAELVTERKKRAEPILAEFREWLLKRSVEVPPSLLLGKAIGYSLSQWDKMTAYLESSYLTPDNNACENALRPFVLGRKNWLFNKSPEGAESSCGMFSLIETAKQNGLVPLHYLTALFERVPFAVSATDWEKLLPWNILTPEN